MINWDPIQENIRLSNGDLIFSLTNPGGPLPVGTTAEIVWGTLPNPTTHAGTVDGDTVSWRVESEDLAAIAHGTPFVIWIHYPNGDTGTTDDYEWYVGHAQRNP